MRFVAAALVVAAGCGRIDFDARSAPDAAADAAPLGPWSVPVIVSPDVGTGAEEEDVTLSSDASELYFGISTGQVGDLFEIDRTGPDSWTTPVTLPFSHGEEATPRLSPDDLTMYFSSTRDTGDQDLYEVHRATIGGAWGTPARIDALASTDIDKWLNVCRDGHYVMVRTLSGVDDELLEGQLGGPPPSRIDELETPVIETSPHLSHDCLDVVFASSRTGNADFYVAHRDSVDARWSDPVPFVEANSDAAEEDPWMSPDRRMFVFASSRGGTSDLYVMTR